MVGEFEIIRSKFVETEVGFFNERLAEEVGKRQKKSTNMSHIAKKVWSERKYKTDENVTKINTKVKKRSTKKMLSEAEDENENTNEIVLRNINENLFVIFDSEKEILSNPIALESICMRVGKEIDPAKESLRKYHLYLEEKEQYPKGRKSVYAGFEKWLMNEKKYTNGKHKQPNDHSPKTRGAHDLLDRARNIAGRKANH
jgi:hypothetical protein